MKEDKQKIRGWGRMEEEDKKVREDGEEWKKTKIDREGWGRMEEDEK